MKKTILTCAAVLTLGLFNTFAETAAAPAGANIEEAKFEEVAPAAITAQSAVPAETMPPIPTPTPVPREEATEEAAPAAIEDDPFNV